ncbi:MAG: L,D-transpeptidase family protein [Spartobacteria bacterium]
MRKITFLLLLAGGLVTAAILWSWERKSAPTVSEQPAMLKTIQDRLVEFGETVRARLTPHFDRAGVHFPPSRLAFVAIKDARRLELWAANEGEDLRFIREYEVLAASGQLGPKLREGDRQVPEGVYQIVLLNPNSRYHLSLRVSYPNEFDLAQAAREGRTEPGTDIMIHGGARSRGCLAVGDEGAEDLFVVAALTETREIPLVISPVDFRTREFVAPAEAPGWTEELYREIRTELALFPKPQTAGR